MKYKDLHRWDLSPKEAIREQYRLRDMVKIKKLPFKGMRTVAGVDVSVKDDLSKAAIVILSFPDLEVMKTVTHTMKTVFPYVPGLLSFREAPVILECVKKLKKAPDLFIFDGQGLAHPRGIGLATHMGLILGRPSIGSAKSHLFGKFNPVGRKKGDYSLMYDNDDRAIGAVLCTRNDTNPVYVSPGHLADIPSSVRIILECSPKYKLPEPIRAAHRAASLVN